MSIEFNRSFFLNPEPITVKGIKTYNPKLLRIYTSKGGEEYPFDPVEQKVSGTALGTIYQKRHQSDSDKRWMGKVGEPRGGFRNDPESTRTRTQRDINLDTIYEKLSYDLFQELGRGLFEVPKTHLSSLPIQNAFLKGNALAMDWMQRGIHESLRIMSYYIEGYHDLKHANTFDGGQIISFMAYLKKYHRPPEKVVTPKGKAVPIEGIVELLAIGRCLADTDLLGGRGLNAGFRWISDEKEQIQSAKVIKIDPGYALNFTAEEGSQDGCVNWVVNTQEGLGPIRYHLEDLKDLQTSNGNLETIVSWEALTDQQKDQFLSALLNASRYLEREDILKFLFYREGCFQYADTADLPEEHAEKTQAKMKDWINWQLEIYDEPLQDFLERHPEQLLRIRYIDDLGELPLPMSERSLPIRELFSDLALVIPEQERHKQVDGFKMLESETKMIQVDQLFSKETKKVVITGESGTGKSTLCQKIAHDWASGRLFDEKFDAVFWIPLRKLNGKVSNEPGGAWLANFWMLLSFVNSKAPDESADVGLAKYVATQILEKPELADPVVDLIQEGNVLFILDGFDEATDAVKALIKPLFEEERFFVLLTTRPQTVGLPDWSHVKNTGFSPRHIEHYIEQFFEENNPSFFSKLKRDPHLFALAKNPFQLQMLCYLEKEGLNMESRTHLYQTMVSQMLKWESTRTGKKITEKLLVPIGKAAYLAWQGREPLSKEHFHVALKGWPFTLKDCKETGLMNGYEFVHASIQEYLIAHYLVSVEEELKAFLSSAHKQEESLNILQFLCGILFKRNPENAQKFFRLLQASKENLDFSLACLNECGSFAGDLPDLQAVLQDPKNLNQAIEYLVKHQYMNAIGWLHKKQPNALREFRDENGLPIVIIAAIRGDLKYLEWIQAHLPDQLQKTWMNMPLMHVAAYLGQLETMQWLFDRDHSLVQKTDTSGITPMHIAAANSQVEAMRWLHEKDPTLFQKTRPDGFTLIHSAALGGHVQAMQWLHDKDPSLVQKTVTDGATPMHVAASNGQVEAMQWLFDRDHSLVQKTDSDGWTPIHSAAANGQIEAMQWLFDRDHPLVQKIDSKAKTPMHSAATNGQVEAMQWLFDRDPSLIQKIDSKAKTPMHSAATNGQVEAMQWLFDRDPSLIQKTDSEGKTPMHSAVKNGQVEAMQWLHGKDPTLVQNTKKDGWTSMHFAAFQGHVKAMQWLFDIDHSLVQKTDSDGWTPMHSAAVNDQVEAMRWLHEKDPILVQKTKKNGWTPMHSAAANGQVEAMQWLFGRDHSFVQKTDSHGWTPMHSAAANGQVEAMQWLFGRDHSLIQKTDTVGLTPMHLASWNGKLLSMQWLHEKDPTLLQKKSKARETALDLAKRNHQDPIIEFIKKQKDTEKCTIS